MNELWIAYSESLAVEQLVTFSIVLMNVEYQLASHINYMVLMMIVVDFVENNFLIPIVQDILEDIQLDHRVQ